MPNLKDHGVGVGGGSALGVPVYPFSATDVIQKYDENGALQRFFGDQITACPENISQQASCVLGEYMYFIGTAVSASNCFKYNVNTKVWTQLSKVPSSAVFSKAWAVPIGTDIYYGGGTYSIYKYDTLTNTHTEVLSNTTWAFAQSRACTDGKDVYIFGGNTTSSVRTYAYKYDVANNTLSRIKGFMYFTFVNI